MIIDGKKLACATCIKGHRASHCSHADRPLVEIKKKGRPATQCVRCRELRTSRQLHVKCDCNDTSSSNTAPRRRKKATAVEPTPASSKALRAIAPKPHTPLTQPTEKDDTDESTLGGDCCSTTNKNSNKRKSSCCSSDSNFTLSYSASTGTQSSSSSPSPPPQQLPSISILPSVVTATTPASSSSSSSCCSSNTMSVNDSLKKASSSCCSGGRATTAGCCGSKKASSCCNSKSNGCRCGSKSMTSTQAIGSCCSSGSGAGAGGADANKKEEENKGCCNTVQEMPSPQTASISCGSSDKVTQENGKRIRIVTCRCGDSCTCPGCDAHPLRAMRGEADPYTGFESPRRRLSIAAICAPQDLPTPKLITDTPSAILGQDGRELCSCGCSQLYDSCSNCFAAFCCQDDYYTTSS